LPHKLLERINAVIAEYDPCKIDGHSCLASKDNPCCFNTAYKREDPSDIRCLYLAEDGHCLNVNLECKVWFCDTCVKAMPKECLDKVLAIESECKLLHLISRPFIGDNYYGADKKLY